MFSTKPKQSQAGPDVPQPTDFPAVAASRRKLAEFHNRREKLELRAAELCEALAVPTAADPASLAERLRAGESLEFTVDDAKRAEAERAQVPILAEIEVVTLAIAQEESVEAEAFHAAEREAEESLTPRLRQIDAEAAGLLLAFARARQQRADIAAALYRAGWHFAALQVGSGGVVPAWGSLSEPNSPISLHLSALARAGLIDPKELPRKS